MSRADAEITPQEVATYLRLHPDFLQNHEELLTTLELPHPPQGGAVSLVERQIEVLRDGRKSAHQRLTQLSLVAESNEQLLQQLHQLILKVMESRSLSEAISILKQGLVNEF
ncbi:MAG: DUF484 family protein, partial [Gammaproteobacteria bacterium]|nr:DUF484 family protein [Gammaproteobacteria bacterium]